MKGKNDRPFICNSCDKTFKRNNVLKQHKIIHNNKIFAK